MININRGVEAPLSLQTDEIQRYIDEAVAHVNDPDNHQKPNKPQAYRNADLLAAFDRDFYGKCYLTEMKYANSWAMDVEHFIPQSERADLVYEWSNLLPADHLANMMKPRRTPVGGYLDPSEPADDVEVAINYALSPFGEEPYFEAADANDQKAVNSCVLLDRLHNGHDNNSTKATSDLRHAIRKKHTMILSKIIDWRTHADGSQEKFQAKKELKDLLSRKASFTMLCRSMPAVQQLPAGFLD